MDHDRSRKGWRVPALLLPATALVQWLSVAPASSALMAHVVWWQGALLMCGLLLAPLRLWPACMAAALVGSLATCVTMDRDWEPWCLLLAGEFLLVAMATWTLRPARTLLEDTRRLGDPALFLLLAGVVLPIAGGAWALQGARALGLPMMEGSVSEAILARALGYLIIVPAFLSALRLWQSRHLAFDPLKPALAMTGVVALVLLWASPLASTDIAPLLRLAPVVLLVWILHTLGTRWAWVVWAITCVACLRLGADGIGPMMQAQGRSTIAHLQWWAITTSVILLLLSALHDQRKLAHARLRDSYERLSQLARRVMAMQENERSRIARDLHDDVNQSLASISIELSALKRETAPTGRERIESLQEHLLGVSDDIRRLSHELHPSMLRYTSLAASLESLCASHSREELDVVCETQETFLLSEQQKLDLFRIAQEALHNAEKHAAATRVRIALRRDGDAALLRIEDDGRGLPPDYDAPGRGGLGMISMAERVKTLRGRIDFTAADLGGTRVDVRFPVGAATR